ncbi:SpoIIE family protein phosphatase [Micromonospora sp. BRA006-A]|nr:SpoIIE family protein phosphatase [Micromonospora sp. BRA006-A]
MLIGVVPDPHRRGDGAPGAGETCLFYSDGVTEARGGRRGDEQFGPERLLHAVTGCHRMPAPALAERVEQVTCDRLAHGDHDDIAVLALRATGPAGGAAAPARGAGPGRDRTDEGVVRVTVPTVEADPGHAFPATWSAWPTPTSPPAVAVARGLLEAGAYRPSGCCWTGRPGPGRGG